MTNYTSYNNNSVHNCQSIWRINLSLIHRNEFSWKYWWALPICICCYPICNLLWTMWAVETFNMLYIAAIFWVYYGIFVILCFEIYNMLNVVSTSLHIHVQSFVCITSCVDTYPCYRMSLMLLFILFWLRSF